MELQTSLTILTKATQMLAEVNTIDDAKHLMDVAAAAKMYAQKHHLGKEAVQHAKKIEIQAEIKMGEYLKDMEKNKGGGYTHGEKATGTTELPVKPATYEEIGITKDEASEAQTLADLSDEEKEKVVLGKKSKKTAVKESKQRKAVETAPEKKPQRNKAKPLATDEVNEEIKRTFEAFFEAVRKARKNHWKDSPKQAIRNLIENLEGLLI